MARLVAFFLVPLLTAVAAPAEPASAPASAPAPASQSRPAAGTIQLQHLRIDRDKRQVVLDAEVCMTNAASPLELLLCKWGTKDYESILRTKAEPSQLHAALIALGLTAGKPAAMTPSSHGQWQFQPPDGAQLQILLRWTDANGAPRQTSAGDWLTVCAGRKASAPKDWVFVGGDILPDGRYAADMDGDIISVSNFADAVIDVPFQSAHDYSILEFAANEKAIPPVGTPVEVVITPHADADKAPAARVMIVLDRLGRLWADGQRIELDALSDWAVQYIRQHAKGQVVIRALSGSLASDVEQVREQLRLGGVADIEEQKLLPTTPALPRTAEQAAAALKAWREKFPMAPKLLRDPALEAEDELDLIERETAELDRLKALWAEYARNLRRQVDQYKASTQPASGGDHGN